MYKRLKVLLLGLALLGATVCQPVAAELNSRSSCVSCNDGSHYTFVSEKGKTVVSRLVPGARTSCEVISGKDELLWSFSAKGVPVILNRISGELFGFAPQKATSIGKLELNPGDSISAFAVDDKGMAFVRVLAWGMQELWSSDLSGKSWRKRGKLSFNSVTWEQIYLVSGSVVLVAKEHVALLRKGNETLSVVKVENEYLRNTGASKITDVLYFVAGALVDFSKNTFVRHCIPCSYGFISECFGDGAFCAVSHHSILHLEGDIFFAIEAIREDFSKGRHLGSIWRYANGSFEKQDSFELEFMQEKGSLSCSKVAENCYLIQGDCYSPVLIDLKKRCSVPRVKKSSRFGKEAIATLWGSLAMFTFLPGRELIVHDLRLGEKEILDYDFYNSKLVVVCKRQIFSFNLSDSIASVIVNNANVCGVFIHKNVPVFFNLRNEVVPLPSHGKELTELVKELPLLKLSKNRTCARLVGKSSEPQYFTHQIILGREKAGEKLGFIYPDGLTEFSLQCQLFEDDSRTMMLKLVQQGYPPAPSYMADNSKIMLAGDRVFFFSRYEEIIVLSKDGMKALDNSHPIYAQALPDYREYISTGIVHQNTLFYVLRITSNLRF